VRPTGRSDLRLPKTVQGKFGVLSSVTSVTSVRCFYDSGVFSHGIGGVHTTCYVVKRNALLTSIDLDESLFPKAVDPSLRRFLSLDLLQFFLDPIANLGKWYEA
jgi:hypothetical protein